MKTAIEKVTWVGRVTVFAVSLAVVLALSVGLKVRDEGWGGA